MEPTMENVLKYKKCKQKKFENENERRKTFESKSSAT